MEKKTFKNIAILVLVAVFFNWSLGNFDKLTGALVSMFSLVMPLLVGGAMAFVVNVPMKSYENYFTKKSKTGKTPKWARGVSLLLAMVSIISIIVFVVGLVVPELISTVAILIDAVPKAITSLIEWVRENEHYFGDNGQIAALLSEININWQSISANLLSQMQSAATNLLNGTFSMVGSIASGVISFIMSFMISIYILLDKEHLARQFTRLFRAIFPRKVADWILHVFTISKTIFANFVSGQCVEAIILGALCAMGMAILRLPYAPMIGALIGLTALIPIAGAWIGGIVGAFMIIMVQPIGALIFIVYLLILQQIESNLIYPKVVGNSVGLPAIWVIASVTIGGSILGVVGMLLAVPTCSVLYTVLKEFVNKKLAASDNLEREKKVRLNKEKNEVK